MLERDIHFGKPTVNNAIDHLLIFLKDCKGKEKICKVITGYGSSGGTHKIKTAVTEKLLELQETHYIKDFIWGNELDIFCAKYLNFKYRNLIPEVEKKILNKGSVFIIL